MARRNLVLVRAGDKSLHPQWLAPERSWDLAVSYYGDHPERYRNQFDVLHCRQGSKWEGVSDFIRTHAALIEEYEFLWMPDDDILCSCQTIDHFFQLCAALDLTIAQPALTPYSFHSWPITLQQPEVVARLTSFVEIMAPCFKVEHLHRFAPFFGENSSGWGYEWLWEKISRDAGLHRLGIVDRTPVFHTRPVGSAGHGGASASPEDELFALLTKFELRHAEPQVLGAFFESASPQASEAA